MSRRWWLTLGVVAVLAGGAATAGATPCRLLQYQLQPDCLVRGAGGECSFSIDQPDFGPQIAVWIESADGATFVDTLMVTNAVALYGIGNRPGRWDLRSGPRFPYGRRLMALPVWAHRRGKLYDALVMNDGHDDWMTFHEPVSAPETFFCRPMMKQEIVDAITCASGTFRDAKGLFNHAMPQSYYPPRGDLVDWDSICIPIISTGGAACDFGDAPAFADINDLDVIATATPPYDGSFTGSWTIPSSLAEGDYALLVEVGKEFDGNAIFSHPSFIEPAEVPNFDAYGQSGNVGQPSVVYRLPFHLSAAAPIADAATMAPAGYGDWTGATGDLAPLDAQISTTPGSGAGRLIVGDGPGGPGTVHISETACAPLDCALAAPPEAPRVEEPFATGAEIAAAPPTSATFMFRQSSDEGAPVIGYDLRYVMATDPDRAPDESQFARWTPAPAPAVAAPETMSTAEIDGLLPESAYSIGLRARGACGWSAPSFIRAVTGKRAYAKLSGCVVVTAAYGSDLAPDVVTVRRQRDQAAARSTFVALAALIYGRSAPPLADLVRRSPTVAATVRALLRPVLQVDTSVVAGLLAARSR